MKLSTMLLPTGEFIFVMSENTRPVDENVTEILSNLKSEMGATAVFLLPERVEIENALFDENARRTDRAASTKLVDLPGSEVWENGDVRVDSLIEQGAEFSPAGLVTNAAELGLGTAQEPELSRGGPAGSDPEPEVAVAGGDWPVGEIDPEEPGIEPRKPKLTELGTHVEITRPLFEHQGDFVGLRGKINMYDRGDDSVQITLDKPIEGGNRTTAWAADWKPVVEEPEPKRYPRVGDTVLITGPSYYNEPDVVRKLGTVIENDLQNTPAGHALVHVPVGNWKVFVAWENLEVQPAGTALTDEHIVPGEN